MRARDSKPLVRQSLELTTMRITIANSTPSWATLPGNLARALEALRQAAHEHSDLVVFPELFLIGYPPGTC